MGSLWLHKAYFTVGREMTFMMSESIVFED